MSVLDAKRWPALLRKLRLPETAPAEFLSPPPAPPASDPLTHQAVYALLLWEASTSQAHAALRRVLSAVVDYNELRVCQAEHIAEWLGEKYPLAMERALRLRAFLEDVYQRQQSVQVSPLLLGSRKDTYQTLAALEGMTPFAAARVVALGLSRPACPIDERLLTLLRREKAVAADASVEAMRGGLSSWRSCSIGQTMRGMRRIGRCLGGSRCRRRRRWSRRVGPGLRGRRTRMGRANLHVRGRSVRRGSRRRGRRVRGRKLIRLPLHRENGLARNLLRCLLALIVPCGSVVAAMLDWA